MTDHDALTEELRALFASVDPVPPAVTEAGKAVLGWRRLDADLAELLSDSALESELAGVRGELRTRSVVFGSADVELDLEVRYEADSVLLLGQITPAGDVTVQVQASDGTTDEVAVDDLGRFRVELHRAARIRLLVVPAGGRAVETSWLAL